MNGSITSKTPIITMRAHWYSASVRTACSKNDLYTMGTNDEYAAMLEMVRTTPNPTNKDVYLVAKDINDHSEGQTVANVMFIIANEAIKYTFAIDGRDDI